MPLLFGFWREEERVSRHQISVPTVVGQRGLPGMCVFGMALVCVVVASSAQTAFAATVVARWRMNKRAGTVMHDSARNHKGILHHVRLGVPGFRGSAYRFNGSSSYVSVPSAGDLNPGRANLAVTIHLKTARRPRRFQDWDLIRKGHYAIRGGEWKVEYHPDGRASCGFKGSRRYAALWAGPSLDNNRWHTIRCVKTSSAIRLIVDGVTHSKARRVGSIANRSPIVIGAHLPGDFFRGSLDEASIAIG